MRKLLLAIAFLLLPTLARAQPADPTGAKGSFVPALRSSTGTFDGMGDSLVLPLFGRQGAGMKIVTSNLDAALHVTCSIDGGTTYDDCNIIDADSGLNLGSLEVVSGTSILRSIKIADGATHLKVAMSSYTSGTSTVTLTAVQNPSYVGQASIQIDGTVPVTQSGPWTVTSDAGTGWAASGLAKESGGNLAAIAAALAGTLTIDFAAPQHVIVDSGAVTVSGTVGVSGTVAATQSGTWVVQPGNTANTTAWLVTGTGGTFPVTGTFWQATQPVSGTFWPTAANAPASVRGGDGTNFYSATNPAPVVSQGQSLSAAYVNATASGDTALLAGASLGNRIYRVECNNTSSSVAVVATLKLGSTTIGKVGLPAAVGQKVWQFAGPNYLPTGASTAVNINLSAGSADVGCSTFYVAN